MEPQYNILQTVLGFLVCIWIIGLGAAFLVRQPEGYWQWTRTTVRTAWKNGWQIIVGIAIGYWLCPIRIMDIVVP